MPNPEYDAIAKRENPTHSIREYQLYINNLSYYGGSDYVYERLTRYPGESKVDFDGSTTREGSKIVGRKEQTHVVPYLRRITDQINNYIFATQPVRAGISSDIAKDITLGGESIDDIMLEVSRLLTVNGWCWIGIDAPVVENPLTLSAAEKDAKKIRPYWQVYTASQVVDWNIVNGEINWLIVEGEEYIGDNPITEQYYRKYRRLWQPGKVTTYYYKDSEIVSKIETPIAYSKVPFVLVGNISDKPIGFDSLEAINRSIMDIGSVNTQNYFNCVYPQRYLPASVLEYTQEIYNKNAEQATDLLLGANYPILLQQGDTTPGIIMPDSDAIGSLRAELKELKTELYDAIGLTLRQESRAAQSAEAKAWDHLDINMVLAARARILEEAEAKCIKICKEWDSTYPVWEPKYNRDFSVSAELDMASIVSTKDLSMPKEVKKQLIKELVKIINNNSKLTANELIKLNRAIDEWDEQLLIDNTDESTVN